MQHTKLAVCSFFSSALGTALMILLAWYVLAPAPLPFEVLALASIVGAVAGSYTGWQYFSRLLDFDAVEMAHRVAARKQTGMPRPLS
jgi:hypothetical protein